MRIFISYRRKDSTAFLVPDVRRALSAAIGEANVFLDIDSIPLGVDFRDHLRAQVSLADAVLAMIGSHWQPERLCAQSDVVRTELLAAQEQGKLIVPIVVGDIQMPAESELPEELRWLVWRNAFTIATPPRHLEDVDRLADYIGALRSPTSPTAVESITGSPAVLTAAPLADDGYEPSLDPTMPMRIIDATAPLGLPASPSVADRADRVVTAARRRAPWLPTSRVSRAGQPGCRRVSVSVTIAVGASVVAVASALALGRGGRGIESARTITTTRPTASSAPARSIASTASATTTVRPSSSIESLPPPTIEASLPNNESSVAASPATRTPIPSFVPIQAPPAQLPPSDRPTQPPVDAPVPSAPATPSPVTPPTNPPGEVSTAAPITTPPATSPPATAPPTTATIDPESAARSQLDAWIDNDRAVANGLVEQWVPQLSAKRKGLVIGGLTFTLQLTATEHAEYRKRYAHTILIPGSAFEGFSFTAGETWYVTLEATPFAEGQEALKWCRDQNIGPGDCFARLITHRRGIVTAMFNP